MIIKEKIKQTVFFAYLTSLLSQFCELGFNVLVFQQFSVEIVGIYGLILSIMTFFNFALDMGLNQTLVRDFSQRRIRLKEAIVGATALRLPVACLCIIVIMVWMSRSPALFQEWVPLSLAILTSILWAQRTLATTWLRAHDRQTLANLIGGLLPLGKLGIGILLIKLHLLQLSYFFGAICLVELLVMAVSFRCVGKVNLGSIKSQSISFELFRKSARLLWKPGLIIFLIGLCAVLQNRLDWLLVYAYISKTELAYYSLANKLYELFVTLNSIAMGTLFPWLCKFVLEEDNSPMIVIGNKAVTFGCVILAGFIALYSPTILRIFWGNKYDISNPMIFLLMYGAILLPACSIPYYYLVACGQEKSYLIIMAVATLAQIGANLILIPRYGGFGATCGMLMLNLTIFIITIFVTGKIKWLRSVGLRRIQIYSAVMLAVLWTVKWQITGNLLSLMFFNGLNLIVGVTILFTKDECLYFIHKYQLVKMRS